MLPNRTGVPVAAWALTSKPVPGVRKKAPRGELSLKNVAGKEFGELLCIHRCREQVAG